ncbi:hypothetical protein AAFF_G00212070 [Aldrovandia affinis]|uniref:Ankyrin repeat domain-containing protein 63 n=1 Tax=Aldrovandia affinis TaxID=143900 RepID=A0AAD7W5G0_9TELE|nr:hypothetical protein AAFF_G00212070 [Aldrovandia affinis]
MLKGKGQHGLSSFWRLRNTSQSLCGGFLLPKPAGRTGRRFSSTPCRRTKSTWRDSFWTRWTVRSWTPAPRPALPRRHSSRRSSCRTARARFTSPLLLLRRGAHVNRRDERGRTALSHACESGHLDAVRALVRNSADPDVVDVWGNSALMYACVAGHASVVDFLVRAFKRLGGLQIDRQNKVGNSAVEVAKHLGHWDCVLALTGRAKRSRESAASAPRGSERDPDEDNFGTKSWDALEIIVAQSESHVVCPKKGGNTAKIDELCFAATSEGRKSSVVRSRMRSMASIEEFERECDADGAPTASAVLSDACAPNPHARSFQPQHGISTMRAGEIISRHFQPSSRCPDPQFPPLFSPRPAKNASNRGACTGATSARPVSPSPLEILLTPILGHNDGGKNNKRPKAKRGRRRQPLTSASVVDLTTATTRSDAVCPRASSVRRHVTAARRRCPRANRQSPR